VADRVRVAIVGSGPAGLSAAARAAALGMSHVLIEKTDHLSDTIYKYQKGKHVMATPASLVLRSDFDFDAGKREAILGIWDRQAADAGISVRYKAEVVKIEGQKGAFVLTLKDKSTLEAEAQVRRFTEAGRRGIVLRMGYFYGPEAESTLDTLALARRGAAILAGPGEAFYPSIWVEDAASAVVAALRSAPAGIYDVVDDEPVPRRELARAIAAAAGRPFVLRPPAWLLKLAGGREAGFMVRSQRVSNARFKAATGWSPSVRDAREGWHRVGQLLRQPLPHS